MAIKLGSIISIRKGKKHSIVEKQTYDSQRLLSIVDLRHDNHIVFTNDKKGTEVKPNDVMIAWDGANAGTIGYGKSGLIGSTIARLQFDEQDNFNANYVGSFLKTKFDYLRQTATGATIPHISRVALESIKIPEFLIDDQTRIATLLSRIEALIATRKANLNLLDAFLKSTFLEMFGPSSPNFSEWPVTEIKDLAKNHKGAMRTGPFGSNLLHSEFAKTGDVAVLGIDNAVNNNFCWGKQRFISKEKYQDLKSYTIYPNDVIVTIMGTIGRSAVIPEDIPLAINTKHLAAITFDNEVANPHFMSYSIHSSPYIHAQFKSKNRGAIMDGLNLTLIKETKINKPPIELQDEFAEVIQKVESIKFLYQQNLTELENLYGVVSQKAFKGELDLSLVPLPETESQNKVSISTTHRSNLSLSSTLRYEFINTNIKKEKPLCSLFNQYIQKHRNEEFTMDRFWEFAIIDGIDFVELTNYELIKKWLYQLIKNGRIQQNFDADKNQLVLKLNGNG